MYSIRGCSIVWSDSQVLDAPSGFFFTHPGEKGFALGGHSAGTGEGIHYSLRHRHGRHAVEDLPALEYDRVIRLHEDDVRAGRGWQ